MSFNNCMQTLLVFTEPVTYNPHYCTAIVNTVHVMNIFLAEPVLNWRALNRAIKLRFDAMHITQTTKVRLMCYTISS